ncbi:MFS transporter [Fructilactobacillus lindneri]|uniref:Transport protein n=1 Tax=Fructilactobacillus lindneri DSM 20690 = JCM 11027 TaxID=1122148 RepID=A0A0R2JTR2_9LACO|nr:MFS transporter [Fructilactobacillus lindneri]KRN80481.1 Transport protein [Fructilactobacillus lindneri DSM 20690 = JCM 11027]SKA03417.1 Major Facilitator Superfamily protein [Fructilactobacillus lindneri DSM 20690 = JCM 11027]
MEKELTKRQKNHLSLGLYCNYFIHGFALVILAQNILSLASSWMTTVAVVSYVISGIGIGRLIAYPITGALADRLSRKMFVYIGMLCYLIFAIGMVVTHQIVIAYGLAILAGIANSALDAGTYTTLVEINDGEGQSTVLLKAFMSVGEFILPLIVTYLAGHGFWFGWSFVIMAGLILLNLVNMLFLQFPQPNMVVQSNQFNATNLTGGRKLLATISLVGYGYTSNGLNDFVYAMD